MGFIAPPPSGRALDDVVQISPRDLTGHGTFMCGMSFALRKESASAMTEITMMTREMTSSVKRGNPQVCGCPTTCVGQLYETVTLKTNKTKPRSRPITDNILSRVRPFNCCCLGPAFSYGFGVEGGFRPETPGANTKRRNSSHGT